jgi:hypothetical protein
LELRHTFLGVSVGIPERPCWVHSTDRLLVSRDAVVWSAEPVSVRVGNDGPRGGLVTKGPGRNPRPSPFLEWLTDIADPLFAARRQAARGFQPRCRVPH